MDIKIQGGSREESERERRLGLEKAHAVVTVDIVQFKCTMQLGKWLAVFNMYHKNAVDAATNYVEILQVCLVNL